MPTWRTLVYQTSEGFWRWKIYEDEAAYILGGEYRLRENAEASLADSQAWLAAEYEAHFQRGRRPPLAIRPPVSGTGSSGKSGLRS